MTMQKINKLRELIFLLLIFLIPTQLGKHFWPTWSFVNGVRIDYLAPTIYVTDVLVVLLWFLTVFQKILSNTIQYYQILTNTNQLKKNLNKILAFVGMIALIFLFVSSIRINPLSIIKLLKLIEIGVFAFLVKIYVNKKTYRQFIFVLSLSMLFQSFLAIAQFFNHGSLNGIFWFFGERNFSSTTPGIANASINGNLILRPYGTLPHPNVLAGYLLLGIIILWSYWRRMKKDEFTNLPARKCLSIAMAGGRIYEFRFGKNISRFVYLYIPIFVIVVSSFVLFLTLSRVAILLWFIFLITNYKLLITNFKLRIRIFVYSLIPIFLVVVFLFPRFISIFTEDSESFMKRVDQAKIAVQMIKDYPVFGVGLNQYLVNLPKYLKGASFRDYQPVHNVFLLFVVETGLVGVLLFLFLIWRFGSTRISIGLTRIKNSKNLNPDSYIHIFLYSLILVISLFDHYFYTTQQGNLMIGLLLGLANLKFKNQNVK
jgi:hypothetical protein